jgi:predicted MFS family arabinose efflux permease
MYGLWQALVRLPLGVATDWLGWRKPFIVVGLGLAGLGAVIMAKANGAGGLIVGRAVTGLAAGTWVPLVVAFSTLFPPQEAVRATATLTLVSSVARGVASSLTGSLNDLGGYALPFLLASGAAGLAILVVLPASEPRRRSRRSSVASIAGLLTRRDVLMPTALQTIAQYANWMSVFGFLPVLAKELGATDVLLGLLTTLNIGVFVLGNLLATAMIRRFSTRLPVYVSFSLTFAGMLAASMARSLPVVIVAQTVIGLGQGLSYPLLMGMSIEHVADDERTTAMGLHQAIYALGMFAGPWLSGMVADALGIRLTFAVTAFPYLSLGLLGTRWLVDRRREGPAGKVDGYTQDASS